MTKIKIIPAILFLLMYSAAVFAQPAAVVTPPEIKKEADLIELIKLDKTIKLDIRYATTNNFTGRVVYPEARAFLQRPAGEAVIRVHKKLKKQGLGIVIYDGYRPWTITKYFWDTVIPEHKKFVADPAKGSKHNRGCAVDLAIYNLKTGEYLDMPSGYDEFTERASPNYAGASAEQVKNRELLRSLMEAEGFMVNPNEWWHFDYKTWQDYGIYDIPFSVIETLENDIAKADVSEKKDWKKIFEATGVAGGTYIYDLKKNKFTIYDRKRFDTGFVPASTSKILHSLIFLDTKAVADENEVIKWDGVKRWVEAWNKDHSLKTALKASAAWFYVEASKRAGRETMQKYYDAANYGNRSTDDFGEDYWVKGNLRVTPRQQIELLVKFYQNRLPFAPQTMAMVKEMIVLEKTDKYTLRGKTGWSQDFDPWVGWLIGYVETDSNVYFFATELDMKKNEDAQKRMEITKRVLRQMKVIE